MAITGVKNHTHFIMQISNTNKGMKSVIKGTTLHWISVIHLNEQNKCDIDCFVNYTQARSNFNTIRIHLELDKKIFFNLFSKTNYINNVYIKVLEFGFQTIQESGHKNNLIFLQSKCFTMRFSLFCYYGQTKHLICKAWRPPPVTYRRRHHRWNVRGYSVSRR